jgi:hypothetical protein
MLRSMVWLAEAADGTRARFETTCGNAPAEVSDDDLLMALQAELRADFERDAIVRFALAYPGDAIDYVGGPLREPERRRRPVIGFEAHNREGVRTTPSRGRVRIGYASRARAKRRAGGLSDEQRRRAAGRASDPLEHEIIRAVC